MKSKKKIVKIILLFFLIILILKILFMFNNNYFDYIKKSLKKILPDRINSTIRVFMHKHNQNYLDNNYNTLFLPELQFNNVYFKKIKLNFVENKMSNFYSLNEDFKTFFIEIYNDNIFIFYKNNIYFSLIKDIFKNNKFNQIKTNLSSTPLGIHLYKDSIYVSIVTSKYNCDNLTIMKAKLNFQEVKFEKIKQFNECSSNIRSGKIQTIKINNKSYLLISAAANLQANNDYYDEKPQDSNSIFGKILLLDEFNGEYSIYSSGHRNILGLYSDENVILASENGPKGGDEINKILSGRNYGWPIASYGDHYKPKTDSLNYKLNHEDYNFEEPIFSFVPSIAPSEIIKLENNFSQKWQNSFLLGSLNSKHLFRLKFDKKFEKLLFYEKIYIGERIRDLRYDNKNKQIFLALENSGSIGILSIKKF